MVTIVVAGGTGGIGRTIVDELVRQNKHKVIVFSRTATDPFHPSVAIIPVDYTSQSTLTSHLQTHAASIVISTLSLFSPASAAAQETLIQASIATPSVTHFIPSEYGIDYSPTHISSSHPAAAWFNSAADLLRSSRLTFTRVIFGQLSDHYVYPHCETHMKQFTYFLDFLNRTAAVPGYGTTYATFLGSWDVGRYVAELVERREKGWSEVTAVASDRMTWKELVELAEEVTGEKWKITYDGLEGLKKGKVTYLEQPTGKNSYNMPEEAGRQMAAEFGVLAAEGALDVSPAGLKNGDFSNVKPVTVRELLTKAWGERR